ncbi:MAG TPA: hypothetical protein VF105_08590 [Gemmatimonadaceae bacterium]
MKLTSAFAVLFSLSIAASAQAQQGYEYEVYNTDLSKPGTGELEWHNNYVVSGTQFADSPDGRTTHHALRSSLELSTGLTNWLEAAVYTVGYARSGAGFEYVGNRGRLTAAAPERWSLPIQLGLSQEVGYARSGFSESRWVYEFVPIVGKKFGPASLVLNPIFERAISGAEREWEFEPRARLAYALDGDEGVGLEYYSVLGPLSRFDERSHQIHQLFATAETELPGGVEAGFGVGRGLTTNSDRWIISTKFEIGF